MDGFSEYFELELATTRAQREDTFRLRYRIFCDEFRYEPAEAYPDHLESDEYDAHSRHFLLRHKSSGMPAACARLVLADDKSPLPLEKFCANAIDEKVMRSYDDRRQTLCEFSRWGVDSPFRLRPGERMTRFGEISALDSTAREQRTFSLIAISTILATFAISEILERTHCFTMLEPLMARRLARSGLVSERVGQEIEYHGVTAPYLFHAAENIEGMASELREFYAAIRSDFAASGELELARI